MFASRDVKAGEVLFEEPAPLAMGPNPTSKEQCLVCTEKVGEKKSSYVSKQSYVLLSQHLFISR